MTIETTSLLQAIEELNKGEPSPQTNIKMLRDYLRITRPSTTFMDVKRVRDQALDARLIQIKNYYHSLTATGKEFLAQNLHPVSQQKELQEETALV